MKPKILTGVALVILLFLVSTTTFFTPAARGKPEVLRVPDMYPTIQGAIDAASAGDTIIVSECVYAEGQIMVYKPLSLIAKGNVIVDGLNQPWVHSFHVTSNNVTIRGFTIMNAWIGIRLIGDNCLVEGNFLTRNSMGILGDGDYNIIKKNRITEFKEDGIVLGGSFLNPVMFNLVEGNEIKGSFTGLGLFGGITLLGYCDENTFFNNKIILKTDPLCRWGIRDFGPSSRNNVSHNIISGGSVGIDLYESDCNIMEKNIIKDTRYGIALMESSGNLIRHNKVMNNTKIGIVFFSGRNHQNTLEKNFIFRCRDGILLKNSDHNTIEENTVIKNTRYGIAITLESNYNTINENKALRNSQFDLYWDGTGKDNTWTENKYRTKNW